MSGGLDPREIGLRAQMAALLEASAPKPGNVSRCASFDDTRFEDFALSAVVAGPALADAGRVGVGAAVAAAIAETRRWVGANTNLGIALLFAPLAAAAARADGSLRARLAAVLAELTVEDARRAYAAIRAAAPGGLGRVPEQDAAEEPTVTLRDAMALAADRDSIAREYVTDFAITFDTTLPALRRSRVDLAWSDAVVETYLMLLSTLPDTLIARKRGRSTAERVRRQAEAVVAAGPARSPERRAALGELDRTLRADGNALNPGTTADLVAAALFVLLLEDAPDGRERPNA